jgi:hypothetical protein
MTSLLDGAEAAVGIPVPSVLDESGSRNPSSALHALVRTRQAEHTRALRSVVRRSRWPDLPGNRTAGAPRRVTT